MASKFTNLIATCLRVEVSPSSAGDYYNYSVETYMLVDDAPGRAMVKLLNARN